MKNTTLLFIISLLIANCEFLCQDNDWKPSMYLTLENKISKIDGKIRYTVDSTMALSDRNELIRKTKRDIVDNLALINESEFNDSLHIVIVRDKDEIKEITGYRVAGLTIAKDEVFPENLILSIYGKNPNPLKHELMHIICRRKWGEASVTWLNEGLAILADPSVIDCDNQTFEERYVFFLQNNMLFSSEQLRQSPINYEMPKDKIFYSQSGYIVSYLIDNYGLNKIKELWFSTIDSFHDIFGLSVCELTLKINNELNGKYPNPIEFNREGFNKRCTE